MAVELAAQALREQGLRLFPEPCGPLLIDGILEDLRAGEARYLSDLRPSHSLNQRIYATVRDIRLAGLQRDAIDPGVFERSEKAEELTIILERYTEALAREALVDYPSLLDMAFAVVERDGTASWHDRLILVPEDLDLTPQERHLLAALPADAVRVLSVDKPAEAVTSASLPNARLLSWVSAPATAPPPRGDDTSATMFHAVGACNEVREVFRRCLEQGLPLDEVEILHTDDRVYVPLIYEIISGIEPQDWKSWQDLVTFADGLPADYSRPGRGLQAWVQWVQSDYSQAVLVDMIEQDLVRYPASQSNGSMPHHMRRTLRSVSVGFGRDRYRSVLEEELAAANDMLETPLPDLEDDDTPVTGTRRERSLKERIHELREARTLVAALLDMTPDPDGHIRSVLDAAQRFLSHWAAGDSEMDHYGLQALSENIAQISEFVEDKQILHGFPVWEWLGALPAETRIMGQGPRPGCVHVAGVARGGHSGRSHTFIIGLDDGRFPGAGVQDPVLLDTERAHLSPGLITSTAHLARTLDRFARLPARLRSTVCLSYSCRNLVDDREMFPSPVLLSAYRILSRDRAVDASDLTAHLGPPVSFAPRKPESALDMTEWWLSTLCRAETVADPDAVLRWSFPSLAQGRDAAGQRMSPEFTEFDGWIGAPDERLDPAHPNGPPVSASRLQTAGQCPLAYFFRYVLRIELPEDLTVDLERWLDPAYFGTLMHDVFHTFVSQRLPQGWPPDFPGDLAGLHDIAIRKAEAARRQLPPPSEQAYQRQLADLLRAAGVFLRVEAQTVDRVPCYVEAALGLDRYGEGTDLDSTAPIELALPGGKTIRARGRLDRIDRLNGPGSDSFAVCDYKSGSARRYETADPFAQGRVVQHGLYLALARTRLRERLGAAADVTEFLYFFPGVRDQGLQLRYDPEVLSDWSLRVGKLCGLMANGAFPPTTDHEEDCRYCDYQPICGNVAAVAAGSRLKLANPRNELLTPFKDLRNRE
jgi:ATP-dependent helicase/nuclease subunit B